MLTIEITGWLVDLLEPGAFRLRSGRAVQELAAAPGLTLEAALREVAGAHPRLRPLLWVGDGSTVAEYVTVLVNGRIWEQGGLAQPLAPGDCVTLIPAYSGG